MVGIILALIFRGIFIALGYRLVENFGWVFYVFGAFLVYSRRSPGHAPTASTRRSTSRTRGS